VLGTQALLPAGGVVLGGMEGFKMHWATATVEQRMATLSKALTFGEVGLDFVIQALQDESKQVRFAAYFLLKERQELRVKQQLWKYLPWCEFEVVTVDSTGRTINRRRREAQFFEEDLGNGVSLTMVSIPGGTFLMGSPNTEEGRHDWESPQHRVTIASLFMSKCPITQAQWQAVAALPQVNCSLNPEPSCFKGSNRPVERVSWYEAVEFCTRLSLKTGLDYRLPSEAEWEYAARADTTTPFSFGDTITPYLANYYCNESYGSGLKGIYRGRTTDVSSFPANSFGLYDMHGNVWEWCADHWQENYHLAPSNGNAWVSNNDYCSRLLRGGSWHYNPKDCRCASRNRYRPDVRNNNIGFRAAYSWNASSVMPPERKNGN
jgi:formylglycine-generating enzyme required for sulfatase activity